MASTGAFLQSGDTLGSFQLLAPIGVGGMGRVWVAREIGSGQLPRLVAIKTALSEDGASEDFWRALFDEARIASLLSHPNLCTIHEVERERGIDYLVMDFSDGGSLRELLDALPERRMELHLGVRIVSRLCAGLHAAHELLGEDGHPLGVVHRDVSPQNVLIAANGQVRLTDFGVARARGQLHAPTQTGEVKGKIAYMAPEQVTTKDIDRRVDIFAAGCVLYEATVGSRPFQGGDALSTLYQLLEEPIVPPSARLPGYPAELEAIVLKAMERDREQRYATAEEFGRALEGWLLAEKALVSDSAVAAVVRSALGSRIAERNRAIDDAVHAIENGEQLLTDVDVIETSAPLSLSTPTGGKTFAGTALPGRGARSPKVVIGVVGAALAAGLAFAFVARGPADPAPPLSSTAPAAAATGASELGTPPPRPGPVVEPQVQPPALPSASPVESAVPVSKPSLPRFKPAPRASATAATPQAAPQSPPPARADGLPTVVKKPIRTLDQDNPFGPQP